ncbi:MAG: molybdopterin-binding protein, partial [Proteobacteria bacterium]|nr:molybdopterin-binding protein [Pseudomonadota bacterium]
DFIKTGLQELGARLHFHKVAMRPGKPLLFAEWDNGPVWFGLPGNPVSTIVGWRFFVDPYLRALCGRGEEQPEPAILQNSIKKPSEMICFYKAYRQNHASQLQLTLLDGQASYMISPLLKANCWAILMPGSSEVKEGDLVVTLPLKAKD